MGVEAISCPFVYACRVYWVGRVDEMESCLQCASPEGREMTPPLTFQGEAH